MSASTIKSNLLITVLSISTMLSLGYGFKKNREHNDLKVHLEKVIKEKETIKEEIASITDNYESAANKNKKLSRRVISEINKIIRLKDSVNSLDNNLKTDQKIISQKTLLAAKLNDKNVALSNKIDKVKLLKINTINVSKMKKKVSGKYTKTSNPKKIDAFKIDVQIQKNNLTTAGKKIFHLQLINPENQIIAVKKQSTINNKILTCSDEIVFNYNNEELNIVSLIEVNRDNLLTGEYKLNTFIGGKLISNTNFNIE